MPVELKLDGSYFDVVMKDILDTIYDIIDS
jgi:hypothetical protein